MKLDAARAVEFMVDGAIIVPMGGAAVRGLRVAGTRLEFVDGLRGVAALYVVGTHICSMVDPTILTKKPSAAPPWLQQAIAPFQYGHLAVAAFIVISGFSLQLSLFSSGGNGRIKSLRDYCVRRARRILPAYYACLALSVLVALTVTARQREMPFIQYLPVTNENVLAHVFLVHNWSPQWMYKINGVLWSIATEAQLYVLFPLLLVIGRFLGRPALILLAASATALVLTYRHDAVKLFPWYLLLFSLGIVSANYAFRPHLKLGIMPIPAAILALSGLGAAFYLCSRTNWFIQSDIPMGIGMASLLYGMTIGRSRIASFLFGLKPVAFVGGFSYSLYLMHHPIEQVVYVMRPASVITPEDSVRYLCYYGLPSMLVGAWLFSLVFEKPFMGRRRAKAKEEAPAEPLRGSAN